MPSPIQYWQHICDMLVDSKHVVLEEGELIPWKEILRDDCCNQEIASKYGNVNIELLDDKDIAQSGQGIAEYFLNLASTDYRVKKNYRPSSTRSLPQYLINNAVLANKITWVKDISSCRLNEWLSFLEMYKSTGIHTGLFVIENSMGKPLNSSKDNIDVVDYHSKIQKYDIYVFCCHILAKKTPSLPIEWNRYIAATVSAVCQTNAEVASLILCSEAIELRSKSVVDILNNLCEANLGIIDDFCANCVHASSNKENQNRELLRRLWQAQVQELFPMLEAYRIQFMQAYESELTRLWNSMSSIQFDQNGQKRQSLTDLELADLRYLMHGKHIRVPDKKQRERLELIWNTRNQLAHLSVCSPGDVEAILSPFDF